MLHVRGLQAFYGKSQVLHEVDLQVHAGEVVSLLGRNGSGRSTLLKAIMGQVQSRGSVLWKGHEVQGLTPFQIANRGIGYVPESRDIFPGLTVHQNLQLGQKSRHQSGWTFADMYRMFPQLGARAQAAGGVLSGGEQQMLALCRTLMGNPELVLMDEPTEGLAPQLVQQVAAFIQALKARGIAVLLVEQRRVIAMQISDRCLVMGHGRLVFDGTPAQLAAQEAVRREWLEI